MAFKSSPYLHIGKTQIPLIPCQTTLIQPYTETRPDPLTVILLTLVTTKALFEEYVHTFKTTPRFQVLQPAHQTCSELAPDVFSNVEWAKLHIRFRTYGNGLKSKTFKHSLILTKMHNNGIRCLITVTFQKASDCFVALCIPWSTRKCNVNKSNLHSMQDRGQYYL